MQGLDENMQQLLIRYLDNEATESEVVTVKQWLSNAENQAYFNDLKKLHEKVTDSQSATPANVDVNAAWTKVEAKTVQQLKPVIVKRITVFTWLKIAAVLVVGFSIFWWLSKSNINPQETLVYKTMKATDSALWVPLPDGSSVSLSPNSSITYPENFDGKVRNVSLSGEGFFIVSRDTTQPFIIESGEASIRVLGTSFLVENIKDSGVIVSVETGKVSLSQKSRKNNVILVKGEQGFLSKASTTPTKKNIENRNYLAAYNKVLLFENTPLDIVLKDLENYFKVQFRVNEATIEGCRITAKFEESSLKEILQTLKIYFSWEIQEKNNIVTITGKGCS